MVADPTYWNINGGILNICSCSIPVVNGNPYFGNVVDLGACGSCECYTVVIQDQDIQDYGQVYLFYQCCDGTFMTEQFFNQETTSRCMRNIVGNQLWVFDGRLNSYVPAPISTVTPNAGSCNPCSSCGTQC